MPKGINQKGKYTSLNARLNSYILMIQQVFGTCNLETAKIAERTGYAAGNVPFRFSDYPETRAAVQKLQRQFVSDMGAVIYRGTSDEWKQSNIVQDLLADKILKYYGSRAGGEKHRVYYQTNSDVLKAFQQRRISGEFNLSELLWNQSENYKTEMEYAISSALEKGTSAVTLSKRLSKYLNDFDRLKDDYKDKYGKAVECQDCEYRSMRLARSEINMAYRTAEWTRWQQMDFVVGFEIKLSKSHHDRMPHGDICDDLAGKYPKDFKWTGWHPNDMCYLVPILKDEDDFWADDDEPSKNEVTDVPENFKDWIAANVQKINNADRNGTLPYFLEDNQEFRKYLGVDYVSDWRHRTRDEKQIRLAWENREAIIEADYSLSVASLRKHAHSVGCDISEFENILATQTIKFDKYGDSELFENAFDEAKDKYLSMREGIDKSYNKLNELLKTVKNGVGVYRSKAIIDEIEQAIAGYTHPVYGKVFSKKAFWGKHKRRRCWNGICPKKQGRN